MADDQYEDLIRHLRALALSQHDDVSIAADAAGAIIALLAERDALRAEVERLNRILGRIVEGDGNSTLAICVGTDAFAAAKEYLRPNTVLAAQQQEGHDHG